MRIQANTIRPGNVIEHDGKQCVVIKIDLILPGKGNAFIAVEMRDLKTGVKTQERWRTADSVERLTTEERPCQFLYAEADSFTFMDNETYDQFSLDRETVGADPLKGQFRRFLGAEVELHRGGSDPPVHLDLMEHPVQPSGGAVAGKENVEGADRSHQRVAGRRTRQCPPRIAFVVLVLVQLEVEEAAAPVGELGPKECSTDDDGDFALGFAGFGGRPGGLGLRRGRRGRPGQRQRRRRPGRLLGGLAEVPDELRLGGGRRGRLVRPEEPDEKKEDEKRQQERE